MVYSVYRDGPQWDIENKWELEFEKWCLAHANRPISGCIQTTTTNTSVTIEYNEDLIFHYQMPIEEVKEYAQKEIRDLEKLIKYTELLSNIENYE